MHKIRVGTILGFFYFDYIYVSVLCIIAKMVQKHWAPGPDPEGRVQKPGLSGQCPGITPLPLFIDVVTWTT